MSAAGPALEEKAAVFQSPDDRRLISAEASSDPAFARELSRMLSLPDGEKRVVDYAKKAVLNELNPGLYPETSRKWPKLRKAVSLLVSELPGAIVDSIDRLPLSERTAALAALARGEGVVAPISLGDLGQFEIIGSLIGSIAGAAASIYNTKLQTSTARQIADMQLRANEQAIQAQTAEAQARTAIANAQVAQALQQTLPAPVANAASSVIASLPPVIGGPVGTLVTALSTDIGGGIPIWMAGLGIYLFLKFK